MLLIATALAGGWTLDEVEHIEVSQDCGSLRVESWPAESLHLETEGMVTQNKGRVVVTPRGCGETRVRLPEGVELRAQTQSADVLVLGLEKASVGTISGDITVRATQDAQLSSVSGDIDLSVGGGTATLMTVSGDVRVKGPTTGLTVQTTTGTVVFNGRADGPVALTSHSGDLLVTPAPDAPVTVTATASSGDVRLAPMEASDDASTLTLFTFSGDAVVETRSP